MKKTIIATTIAVALSLTVQAQRLSPVQISQLARKHARSTLPEYLDFLRVPNNGFYPEQMDQNMDWATAAFIRRGFAVQRLPTGNIDWLFAQRDFPGAEQTVLFYMHIDGQPVDRSKWEQESPYQPVLKVQGGENQSWTAADLNMLDGDINPEWRIFARSSADAKGPVVMFLAAMDALAEAGITPGYNIKVIMDCEEEQSAPHLNESVARNSGILQSDMMVILDGPVHLSGQPTLVFGARGIASLRITTYGPRSPQHSGHYGNYAPNPALRLAQLLGSMKDREGRVIIPGFYDGIGLDDETRKILKTVPDNEDVIQQKLGIAGTDKVGSNLQEALQYPSLNIRGMAAGWVGSKVRTIIPSAAVAHLDIRLVQESDADRLIALVKEHIENEGFHILETEPSETERMSYDRLVSVAAKAAYPAFRTPMDSDIGRWLGAALQHTFREEPVRVRTLGGSVPISPFVNVLKVPAVILPLVNADNNQHSPNENLRMGNYFDGVKSLLGVLNQPLK